MHLRVSLGYHWGTFGASLLANNYPLALHVLQLLHWMLSLSSDLLLRSNNPLSPLSYFYCSQVLAALDLSIVTNKPLSLQAAHHLP